jgi:hypothetical protein
MNILPDRKDFGLQFVELDLERSLETQGPFDALLLKVCIVELKLGCPCHILTFF